MTITLMDPGGGAATEKRSIAAKLASLDGARIGLLTNGKHNADVLLRETAQCFVAQHGCEVLAFEDKGNATRPAPAEMIEKLAAEVDFLITAVGD